MRVKDAPREHRARCITFANGVQRSFSQPAVNVSLYTDCISHPSLQLIHQLWGRVLNQRIHWRIHKKYPLYLPLVGTLVSTLSSLGVQPLVTWPYDVVCEHFL